MKREIKFRGKTKDDGMWVYGDLTTGDTIHTSPSWYEDGEMEWWGRECYDNTIGQYTGLKDKNGREIYEGDIYTYRGYEVSMGRQTRPERQRVVGSNIESLFKAHCLVTGNGTVKVIGNIHDNPELLEKENIDT